MNTTNQLLIRPMKTEERTPARILLVDDDRKLASMLAEFLEAQGYTVAAVHDGAEGLVRLRAESWDLVVLDVMMPR
ncbi:MAG TPA: response regulator, partial [Nevskia sp.]|nr:response regulator [Nevskia sp.]